MIAVGTDETVAPIVERVAILPHAGDRFVAIVDQVEAKIHAAEVDWLGAGSAAALDLAAAKSVGDVDPVIESQNRMADAQLRVLGGEALEQDLALVGLAVAVGVAQVDDVRRGRYHDPAPPGH